MTPRALWIAFSTIVMRDVNRYLRRIWIQTFVPPVITAALYFLIFGKVVGSRLGHLQGLPYMLYIIPGLIMMPIINNAYANGSFTFFSSKFQRSLELLLISPIPDGLLISAFVFSSMLRGLIVGCLVFVVSLFFIHYSIAHLFLALLTIALSAVFFATLGLINGIYAKSFDSVSIIPTFILTPLTYLGGVFYAVSLLPHWAQVASLFNPIFYIVSIFKYAVVGIPTPHLSYSLLLLFVLDVVMFYLALKLFRHHSGLRP